jgi:hypothetical protein
MRKPFELRWRAVLRKQLLPSAKSKQLDQRVQVMGSQLPSLRMPPQREDLDAQQRFVLDTIFEVFRDNAKWPTVREAARRQDSLM